MGRGRRKSVRSGQLRYRTAVGCIGRNWKRALPVPVTAVMSHDLSLHELSRFSPGLYLGALYISRYAIYDGGKPNLPLQANPEKKETQMGR